jgi:hypothetical protein
MQDNSTAGSVGILSVMEGIKETNMHHILQVSLKQQLQVGAGDIIRIENG